ATRSQFPRAFERKVRRPAAFLLDELNRNFGGVFAFVNEFGRFPGHGFFRGFSFNTSRIVSLMMPGRDFAKPSILVSIFRSTPSILLSSRSSLPSTLSSRPSTLSNL